MRFFRKLALLFRRDKFSGELDEEMAFHRELAERELIADGMDAQAARHAARRRFGNETRLREQSHEAAGFRLENVLQDSRFALRQLRKNPGFTVTAMLVMALGIASSVTIFAFVDAALLQPLPYENPSRLVHVTESSSTCADCVLSYPDYQDWKKSNKVFSAFEVWEPTSYLWKSAAGVESLRAGRVSGGFFHALGVTPALGRAFTDADDTPAAPRTVVLPYGTWQRWFGGRKNILGQSIILDEQAYTVIGVLPKGFHFAFRSAELWVTIHNPDACDQDRACRSFSGVARLKDDISVSTALADMKSIAARLEAEYPQSNQGQSAMVMPLQEAIVSDIRPILLVLACGAGLLLLIAFANEASLLLVRAENRRREIALRGALGASKARLVRQFVTEGIVLVVVSAAGGLATAYVGIRLLFSLIPERLMRGLPFLESVGLHSHTLLFAFAVSLLGIAIFTVTPWLRLSAANLRDDLAEGGRTAAGTTWKRFGSHLVAAELAIAAVLLAGAGLLGKSFYRLLHVDLNFQPDHIATLEVDVPSSSYPDRQRITLLQKILQRVSIMPGVIAAGQTTNLPVTCNCSTAEFRVQGKPWNGEHNLANERSISPDYFRVLQAKLISGRFFTEADDATRAPVVIINRTLARQYFPNEDPLGKTIGDKNLAQSSLAQIVGVVDDVRESGLDEQILPAIYRPFNQSPGTIFLTVRTRLKPVRMLPVLVAAVHQADPNVGVRNEFTIIEHINDTEISYLHRASAWMAGGFAAMALLLGVVGLYGVIAYSVSRRTREIGVRMALGAQRGAVYRLILGEAGKLAGFGLSAGLGLSLFAAMLLRRLLFGVQSWDTGILAGVVIVLTVAALLASYFPARRAASVDPVEALRSE